MTSRMIKGWKPRVGCNVEDVCICSFKFNVECSSCSKTFDIETFSCQLQWFPGGEFLPLTQLFDDGTLLLAQQLRQGCPKCNEALRLTEAEIQKLKDDMARLITKKWIRKEFDKVLTRLWMREKMV